MKERLGLEFCNMLILKKISLLACLLSMALLAGAQQVEDFDWSLRRISNGLVSVEKDIEGIEAEQQQAQYEIQRIELDLENIKKKASELEVARKQSEKMRSDLVYSHDSLICSRFIVEPFNKPYQVGVFNGFEKYQAMLISDDWIEYAQNFSPLMQRFESDEIILKEFLEKVKKTLVTARWNVPEPKAQYFKTRLIEDTPYGKEVYGKNICIDYLEGVYDKLLKMADKKFEGCESEYMSILEEL